MALSENFSGASVTTSTAANFIPEIWTDGVKNYLERALIFEQVVDSSLNGLVKGRGDVFKGTFLQVTIIIMIGEKIWEPKS